MVSFCWLDKKEREASKHGQPAPQDIPSRPAAVNVVPGCQYSSVPTEGDRDKDSANGAPEYITSV